MLKNIDFISSNRFFMKVNYNSLMLYIFIDAFNKLLYIKVFIHFMKIQLKNYMLLKNNNSILYKIL